LQHFALDKEKRIAIIESVSFTKKAREDHKKTIDQGFDKLAELFDNKEDRTARKG